jgi:hypothetical protein
MHTAVGAAVFGTDTELVNATLGLGAATVLLAGIAAWSALVAARGYRRSLLPIVVPARPDGRDRTARFGPERHVVLPNADTYTVVQDEKVYVALCIANIGPGIAVIRGTAAASVRFRGDPPPDRCPPLTGLCDTRQEIYAGPSDPACLALTADDGELLTVLKAAITSHQPFALDLVYSDHTRRQMTVVRIEFFFASDVDRYVARAVAYWRRRGLNRRKLASRLDAMRVARRAEN